ncbi:MFS-type transporter involved in bile tolerance, Atg22 family [Lentzea waywayandensis]|uniref:MFS-type transporter involved in bile tolerance, Atg22 family n=1 Tax=Lentzea waywayandensis TaxID=84724 RepID=A0A1I6FFM1_9PSEU|nr:MFS transporter [Lentzea waywayandensis]SFR28730.1 MFS-type transporter involved in bile tolerance, Atg22 family [Lentzea waywayandensis]
MGAPEDASRGVAAEQQPPATLRTFWLLTGSSAASELGTTFLHLAIPLTILAGTGSSMLAALSLGVQYLPFVLSPALGTLIDGFERRRVFLASELAQAVLVAMIPFLLMAGQVTLVFVPLLLASCANVVSNLTSDFGLLPTLVPSDRVTWAYSKYAATTEIARCVGPALAGVVLATLGPYVALWIDAGTFLLTAVVALMLPKRPQPPVERGFIRMQVEGFRSFKRIPGIPKLTLALSMHNLGAGAVPIVMVLLVQGTWGWSSKWTGLVIAAGAAGSALGAWLADRVWVDRTPEKRIGLWFALCAISCALLLLPVQAVVIAGFVFLMAAEGGMNVTTNEYRFRAIPDEVSGRTNAVMRAFILGALSLSSLLLGWSVALPEQVFRFAPALLASALAAVLWIGLRRAASAVPEVSRSA